jgi:hypothetical protein
VEVSTQVSVAGFPPGQSMMGGLVPVQVHRPLPQVPTPQTWPQVPQLFGSIPLSTHCPEQTLSAGGAQVQTPAWQEDPALQAMPHPPQLRGSVPRSVQPRAQEVVPAAQDVVELVQLAAIPAESSASTHTQPATCRAYLAIIELLPGVFPTFADSLDRSAPSGEGPAGSFTLGWMGYGLAPARRTPDGRRGTDSVRARVSRNLASVFCRLEAFRVDFRDGRAPGAKSSKA